MADQFQFLLDSPLLGKVKNDRTMMVWNFFALSKERVTELPLFRDDQLGVRIEVVGTKYGVATVYDKEVLIYIASLMQDKLNRGEMVNQRFTFTAHDYFRVCKIMPGGRAYERLAGALERLQGTQIRTNIETGGEGSDKWFSWLKDAQTDYRIDPISGDKMLKSVTVELCDWLYRAILKDGRMLTYSERYFDLAPLERRLYEIARAHCGSQGGFRMNIEKLRRRVGASMQLKRFKLRLLELQGQKNCLPDYYFVLGYKGMILRSDTKNPRVPLKSIQVMFGRLDKLAKLAWAEAPLIDEFLGSEL
jgi:plasmid replication initiation protein